MSFRNGASMAAIVFDKRYASTEMINPNFVAIAEGYYIKAKKVTKREDLDALSQK
jgi:acetolactate synthase-1/2/3 large subunit